MCFLVGNDFLPHLPSLAIQDNAIEKLITIYKKNLGQVRAFFVIFFLSCRLVL